MTGRERTPDLGLDDIHGDFDDDDELPATQELRISTQEIADQYLYVSLALLSGPIYAWPSRFYFHVMLKHHIGRNSCRRGATMQQNHNVDFVNMYNGQDGLGLLGQSYMNIVCEDILLQRTLIVHENAGQLHTCSLHRVSMLTGLVAIPQDQSTLALLNIQANNRLDATQQNDEPGSFGFSISLNDPPPARKSTVCATLPR
jgi:hypothetical protein